MFRSLLSSLFVLLTILRSPRSTLFPYTTLFRSKKLGFDMLVYAHVRLSNHGRTNLAEFERLILSYDEVTECYSMAGTMDFMLRIISKGIEGYEQFVRDNLLNLEFVQEVHSNVTMTCVKRSTSLPL